MNLTYKQIKQVAEQRSQAGQTLRLEEIEDGWLFQWRINGVPGIIHSGTTTARTKPVAFAMALGVI
jgi:hypothetical protein